MPDLGICKCCKKRVSNEAVSCPHCGQPNPYDDRWGSQIIDLVRQGKKIEAIKMVREQTGWGLTEAKQFVDSIS